MKKDYFVAMAVSLCIFSFGLTGCDSEARVSKVEASRPVKALKVTGEDAIFERRYLGRVKPCREVNLSFRVKGKLIELPIRAGQEVQKGQIIARLDPRDYRIKVSRAKAAFEEAHGQYQRYRRLATTKSVSKSVLDAQRRAYLMAKAGDDEARAALADTYLRAPFSGMVAETMVENHQEVEDKQPVALLQDISKLEVVVQVPERDMIRAQAFEKVELFVSFGVLPGREFPARLKEQTTQADPSTQTFSVTVVFPLPRGFNVLPGMTAELRARSTGQRDKKSVAIMVPVEAVLSDDNKHSSVWTIDPETMRVKQVPVKLGTLSGGRVSVIEGLAPGDTIVVAGLYHLHNGMKVRIMNLAGGRILR